MTLNAFQMVLLAPLSQRPNRFLFPSEQQLSKTQDKKTRQDKSKRLFIQLVYNGDMKVNRNGVRLLDQQHFPGKFRAEWQTGLHCESEVCEEPKSKC